MFFVIFVFFWKFIKTWVKNWVATPAMPSITALTICTRSPASTYCGGTPVGIVDGCASDLSCCSAATGGTPSVWLGLPPPLLPQLPPARFRVVLSEHEIPYHPRDLRLTNLGHLGSRPSFLRRATSFVSLARCVPSWNSPHQRNY